MSLALCDRACQRWLRPRCACAIAFLSLALHVAGCGPPGSPPATVPPPGEPAAAPAPPSVNLTDGAVETETVPQVSLQDPPASISGVPTSPPITTQPASDFPGELTPPPSQASAPIQSILDAARAAMAERDILTARRQLDSARAQQRTLAERTEVERVWLLYQSWIRFWAAVRESKGELAAGQQLELDGETVEVMQLDGDQVTLKPHEGEARTLSLVNPSMPADLALALARRSLARSGPLADREVAVFHLLDREGDAAQAASLSRALYDRGINVDLLLPELP